MDGDKTFRASLSDDKSPPAVQTCLVIVLRGRLAIVVGWISQVVTRVRFTANLGLVETILPDLKFVPRSKSPAPASGQSST